MKILKHPKIDQDIIFNLDCYYHLVIENQLFYRQLVYGLKNQIENDDEYFLFYENEKEESLSKKGIVLDNLFDIKIDDKKATSSIQKELTSGLDSSKKEQFSLLNKQINEYLQSLTYDYNLSLEYDDEISLASLLKLSNVRLRKEEDTYLLSLLAQVKAISFLQKTTIFFFINLHDFLSDDEFIKFIISLRALEIDFLLISSHFPINKPTDEFIIRIDNDLCELHLEANNKKD
ncbi:MAG: type II-A CRISPR-associated protein Csn2 [Bacilli bacterium]